MKVQILTSTPNALQTAFTAIRTCYSAHDQNIIWNEEFTKYKNNNDDHIRLVKQIVSHGHLSTLEHINFTFSINEVSRSLMSQLTRHRVGFSYSIQSQRYVSLSNKSKHGQFEYVIPENISNNKFANNIVVETFEKIQDCYDKLRRMKIKAEDARCVLPNATTTNITLTCNLRAFIDLYSKRNKNTHSQSEISELVEKMSSAIIEIEPWVSQII